MRAPNQKYISLSFFFYFDKIYYIQCISDNLGYGRQTHKRTPLIGANGWRRGTRNWPMAAFAIVNYPALEQWPPTTGHSL